MIGGPVRRAIAGLEVEGRLATEQALQLVESITEEVVAAPQISRAVDRALAAGLMDTIARSVVEHRLVEQVVGGVAESADVETVLEHEATRKLIEGTLASPAVERVLMAVLDSRLLLDLTEKVMRSPEMQLTIERIAGSEELRRALTEQTSGLAEEMVGGVRRRSETPRRDGRAQRPRVAAQTTAGRHMTAHSVPYAGIATRAVALTADTVIVQGALLLITGMLALIGSLVGDIELGTTGKVIAAGLWVLAVAGYFVTFWSAAGQTPGMRAMHIRVAGPGADRRACGVRSSA